MLEPLYKFFRLIRSVRRSINITALAALLIVVSMELWLKKIPEIFSYGAETGEIIYRICLSIISSYIFYFIVVHLKTERDRENINQYVANKVRLIIFRCEGRLAKLMGEDNISRTLLRQTSEIDISRAFEHHRNALNSDPQFWTEWNEDLSEEIHHSTESINKIFRKMPWLDSELVQILAKMEDSLLLLTKNLRRNFRENPAVDPYFKYLKVCIELSDYFNAKLAEHSIINIPYSEVSSRSVI